MYDFWSLLLGFIDNMRLYQTILDILFQLIKRTEELANPIQGNSSVYISKPSKLRLRISVSSILFAERIRSSILRAWIDRMVDYKDIGILLYATGRLIYVQLLTLPRRQKWLSRLQTRVVAQKQTNQIEEYKLLTTLENSRILLQLIYMLSFIAHNSFACRELRKRYKKYRYTVSFATS